MSLKLGHRELGRPPVMRSESGQRHQQGWRPRLWGRELLQQELSPQEMSHGPVGAAATSASAAGVSGGEQVPETASVCVCVPMSSPTCACTHRCPPDTCAHRCTPGLCSESSRQIVGCPVWEHWLSLLLTEFEVVGVKQEGAGFRPQGPPTEWQAVGACLWACEVSWRAGGLPAPA